MTQFVDSLYRLYKAKRINKDKIDAFLSSKKITQQEYDYIISAGQIKD